MYKGSKDTNIKIVAKDRDNNLREKHTNKQRLRVIKWYLKGVGIMAIERMEGVYNPLIIKWIRKFSKILRQRLNETPKPDMQEI